MAPLLVSSRLLMQLILAVVISLRSALLSPPLSAESPGAAHESPEDVCGDQDSYPSFPPCASSCQTNFPQRVFTKLGGILCQWQWVEEKQLQIQPFISTPSYSAGLGQRNQSLDVLARGMEIYYICCVLWVQFSGSLLHAENSSILVFLQMYWEKPTVLCHCTYFCISPSKNNLSWKDMNFLCVWKKT